MQSSMAALHGAHVALLLLTLFFVAGHGFFFFPRPIFSGFPGGSIWDAKNVRHYQEGAERNFETNFMGAWQIVQTDSGVSAMHLNLLPNNKIIMFDMTAFRISNMKLPNKECIPFVNDQGFRGTDCWCHSVEYDVATSTVRPMKVVFDPWCSSGGLAPDGTLVSTGGWFDGNKTVRFYKSCDTCDWREYQTALARPRWYATQATLPDGSFILFGGRKSYSFEYVPREGQTSVRPIHFPFLDETTDLDENNLYPFVHLSTDGNLFVFANRRSVLLSLKAHQIIREYPLLGGGARNYPASGMSALLPIKLGLTNPVLIPAEVIVCGGAKPEAYRLAENKTFLPAMQDCGRIEITNPNAVWKTELMPSRRVMGDMMILPTGDLLLLNGATTGTAAWNLAEDPNFTPALYSPDKPQGHRFKELNPSKIARMYHSTAAVIPDGKIIVAGSNTNPGYMYKNVKYPTELRIETFSPPYLDPALNQYRPEILTKSLATKLKYGQAFGIDFKLQPEGLLQDDDIKVTMYPPPFTTHGYSMSQRLLILGKSPLVRNFGGSFTVPVVAPPYGAVAPPGYYLLFVVYRGVPSVGVWVNLQ